MTSITQTQRPSPPTGPIVGNPAREYRRAMVAAAKVCVLRRTSFHGWLQNAALSKYELTRCGCGLINCR